jgi:hypothetical protein
MDPEMNTTIPTDDEHLVLGRSLMDRGFRDLFRQDDRRACKKLGISLTASAIERIHRNLDKLDALDLQGRGAFTTRLNSRERWKQ